MRDCPWDIFESWSGRGQDSGRPLVLRYSGRARSNKSLRKGFVRRVRHTKMRICSFVSGRVLFGSYDLGGAMYFVFAS